MSAYRHPDVPLVAVYNYLETFSRFLSRADDVTATIESRLYHGDRALFWLGDTKLLFVITPIPHVEYLCQRWGYSGTHTLAPTSSSHRLCLDILRESRLLNQLIEYAGPGRTVQLIPWATTLEFLYLAETLRTEHGLTVLLPESPAPEHLWLRDYIDTKSGFRILASQWLSDPALLPFGMICHALSQAAGAAYWFNTHGQTCIVKPDRGESGIGQVVLSPGGCASAENILSKLQGNPFLRDDLIIVESYVPSSRQLSPSLELFVPPLGTGKPRITYLSNQLFESGRFAGVLISRDLLNTQWYPLLAESGLVIAMRLQEMGYVGHFDLDAIVDDQDQLFLLEVNARRTSGTFVHEFAQFTFGLDYLDQVVLLSNSISGEGVTSLDELLGVIGDLLYPMDSEQRGVVVTVTSVLATGRFGYIIVAPSTKGALALQQTLVERFREAGRGAA